MKKNSISFLLISLLALSLAACSALTPGKNSAALGASGTIEAEIIHLAPEIGGRITAINAQRGDKLSAGAEVFRLDDSALQAQLSQASAALQAAQAAQAAAKANLALLQAGPTESQLQVAQAQLDQAEASRQAAQTNLWALTAGVRPEEISAVQARLDFARSTYYNLVVVLSSKQLEDVNLSVTQATSNLAQAQQRKEKLDADLRTPPSAADMAAITIQDAQQVLDQVTQAYQAAQDKKMPYSKQIEAMRITWSLADLNLSRAKARRTSLQADGNMTQEALDAAKSAVDDAQTLLDKCKTAYNGLSTGDNAERLKSAWKDVQDAQNNLNKLARSAQGAPSLESLLSQLNAAAAQRDAAQANLTNLKNGARQQQIDAAQAQVDAAKAQVAAAQAAVDLLNVQIGKLSVKAPTAGVVLDRALNAGEIAAPGAVVVELGSLDKVTLTVYIPEDQYGNIQLGQQATIKVDSFPGKTFEGVVEYISDQAEFTPRNVQTVESRSTTVYAVKIGLQNPDRQLKPGMPADAEFQVGQAK